MRESPVPFSLKRLYGKLLGERARILQPPKRLLRLKADRESYAAQEGERSARLSEIETALPHVAFVIKMLDPGWDATTAKITRPNERREGIPAQGFASAAMGVLWDAARPLTIAEIAQTIADDSDVALVDVPTRQRYHTAVNNSLMTFRSELVCYADRYPNRWAIRARGFTEDHESPD
jgi:hypothetical protein